MASHPLELELAAISTGHLRPPSNADFASASTPYTMMSSFVILNSMNCKIGFIEWTALIVLTILLDIVQVILELFIIGIILNRIIDFIVGLGLPFYFWMRGVSMKSGKNWIAFLSGFGLEESGLGGDDGLPFWTAEVIVVWLGVFIDKIVQKIKRKNPVLAIAMGATQKLDIPLNKSGVRLPQTQSMPLNQDGMRRPSPPSASVSIPVSTSTYRGQI